MVAVGGQRRGGAALRCGWGRGSARGFVALPRIALPGRGDDVDLAGLPCAVRDPALARLAGCLLLAYIESGGNEKAPAFVCDCESDD